MDSLLRRKPESISVRRLSKLTNEVQRRVMLLPWERAISNSASLSAAKCRLRTAGCSVPEITVVLDRASSVISRELKRNASANAGWSPAQVSGRLSLD